MVWVPKADSAITVFGTLNGSEVDPKDGTIRYCIVGKVLCSPAQDMKASLDFEVPKNKDGKPNVLVQWAFEKVMRLKADIMVEGLIIGCTREWSGKFVTEVDGLIELTDWEYEERGVLID